jgi:hypothetical protein
MVKAVIILTVQLHSIVKFSYPHDTEPVLDWVNLLLGYIFIHLNPFQTKVLHALLTAVRF